MELRPYRTVIRKKTKQIKVGNVSVGGDSPIDYVHESAKKDYENIAAKYWPGALTIVIPASEKQTVNLTSNDLTIGLRIPNSNIAQCLLRETGPLLT